MLFLDSVIGIDFVINGLKFNIFAYISIGDIVPLVKTTLWNFSNTGLMPMLESRQESVKSGSNLTESSG